ncbi:MAG TPA: molybdenum cofactor guanylyltransferase [Planctomycetaceae bacterium]|nr:molybdenum cofactor guanylyltransferase [Planctomycetaceae bacterium]
MEILSVDRVGGIVLCGGQSTRMGRPKLSLPFGDETMLSRVVRIIGEVVSPVVVVASVGQDLPPLPPEIIVARDTLEEQGPLAGLAAGFAALGGRANAAYVSSCDVPLLKVEFVRAMIDALGTHEMAIPCEEAYYHPLAGVYRTTLELRALKLLAAGNRRPQDLVRASDARLVDVADLRGVDAELDSLRNANTPADYEQALRAARIGPQ